MDAPRVEIDGTSVRRGVHKQYKVVIGGQSIPLQAGSFRLLALLALKRRQNRDAGWVPVTDVSTLSQPGMVARYVYRLKQQVRSALMKTAPAVAAWR